MPSNSLHGESSTVLPFSPFVPISRLSCLKFHWMRQSACSFLLHCLLYVLCHPVFMPFFSTLCIRAAACKQKRVLLNRLINQKKKHLRELSNRKVLLGQRCLDEWVITGALAMVISSCAQTLLLRINPIGCKNAFSHEPFTDSLYELPGGSESLHGYMITPCRLVRKLQLPIKNESKGHLVYYYCIIILVITHLYLRRPE